MKWIRERDALIAQTLAFVQSVTGKKDDLHPPEPLTAFTLTTEIVTVQALAVEAEPQPARPAPEPAPQASDNGSRRSMTCPSSFNRTGLFSCMQFWSAMSRNVLVEMSPVRMTAGISRWSRARSWSMNCSPFSPRGRL